MFPTARPAPVAPARTESVVNVLRATVATAVISGLPATIPAVFARNAAVQVPLLSIRRLAKTSGISVLIVPPYLVCLIIAEAAPLPAVISLPALSAGLLPVFAI